MLFRRKKSTPLMPIEDGWSSNNQRYAPRSPDEAAKPVAAPDYPPRIKPSRGGLLATLSGLLTFVVIAAFCVLFGMSFLDQKVREPGPLAADKVVWIQKNSGLNEISALLKQEGVIDQTLLFEAYALLNRQRGALKAGEFAFKARGSIDDAIDTLTSGKAILHAITLPEGLTSGQILDRLTENEILTGDVREVPREGTLLPDTYKFERGTTRQQIVALMQAKQREVLNQVWARRSPELPIRTPQELVILASIVEKETGRGDERARVAGVFVNRLGKRMKLQSDPTIVYGLVGTKGTLGRGILRSEIERATPYNTYVVEGLPPGPITNPGKAALEAAATPARTKDLFFVADGTGGHAFAETLDQHNRNVARWRQVEQGRAAGAQTSGVDRAEPPPDTAPLPGGASAFTEGTPPAGAATGSTAPRPRAPAGRGRAFDASEGTPRDPLANRNFDLNSPQTVPPSVRTR